MSYYFDVFNTKTKFSKYIKLTGKMFVWEAIGNSCPPLVLPLTTNRQPLEGLEATPSEGGSALKTLSGAKVQDFRQPSQYQPLAQAQPEQIFLPMNLGFY